MKNPLTYEFNGRIWLKQLEQKYSKRLNLSMIPETEIQALTSLHIDYLWLMGIWQTGSKSLAVSRDHPALQQEYHAALPDLKTSDITGSPYAIAGYKPAKIFGSLTDVKNFRRCLNGAGIKLILDFIPNHTGLDHPWLRQHPQYYVHCSGTEAYYQEYYQKTGCKIAHGKDPFFPPWTDTLQLDYTNRNLRKAQIKILKQLAQVCDGVRCDMAMLVTSDIFQQTWCRRPAEQFWPQAITTVKQTYSDFIFMAEVYWDREWQLQQLGFDYTYDKRLYDRLHASPASEIAAHLRADPDFQAKSVRFIENHDEPRAAAKFGRGKSLAAATVILTLTGMRFIHQGQLQGYRIKLPVQLNRMLEEITDKEINSYYRRLLAITSQPIFNSGQWHLESCSDQRLLYWTWRLQKSYQMVVINYSQQTVETNIPLPEGYPLVADIAFIDELTGAAYVHRERDLKRYGLYIKLAPYQSHIFSMKRQT